MRPPSRSRRPEDRKPAIDPWHTRGDPCKGWVPCSALGGEVCAGLALRNPAAVGEARFILLNLMPVHPTDIAHLLQFPSSWVRVSQCKALEICFRGHPTCSSMSSDGLTCVNFQACAFIYNEYPWDMMETVLGL